MSGSASPGLGIKAWAAPCLVATGLESFGIVALLRWPTHPLIIPMLVASHAVAIVAAGFPAGASRSQRALLAAFTLALPLVGTAVAVLAIRTRGRGDIAQPVDVPADPDAELDLPSVADVHRLTDALPVCEALLSGSPDERSATVAMLARHPDADAIALLRRAVARGDSDVAVEAALTLEDLGARLDAHAAAARAALDENPEFERAVADADLLSEAIHSGLPDFSSLATLIGIARRGYETAAALQPERLPELASRWVRLELDALCPQAGLSVLERAAAVAPDDRLEGLRVRLTYQVAREARSRQAKAET